MSRYLTEPLHPGILHLDVGVEALGDGVADEGGALFLQQLDLPLLLLHQRVDPPRLPIQEGGDGSLFSKQRHE